MLPGPLLVGLLSLAAAPVLSHALSRRPAIESFGAGVAQVVLIGLVVTQVVPLGVAEAGWVALPVLLLGLVFAFGSHRLPGIDGAARAAGVVALLVHGMLDGMAFGLAHDHAGHVVAWAVAAHGLPVGLVIWRVGSAEGRSVGAVLLGASILATLAGYAGANWLHGQLGGTALILLQCLLAGALLHLASHWPAPGPRSSGLGALVGVGVVVATTLDHPIPRLSAGHLEAGRAFLFLLLESAPALLAGYLGLGVMRALRPAGANDAPAGFRLDAALLSLPLLGWLFTITRVTATVVATLAVQAVSGARGPARPATAGEGTTRPAPRNRVSEGLRAALVESVDRTAGWVLAGLGVAALAEALLGADVLSGVPKPAAVVFAAVLGLPVYLCAVGITPLLAVLLHKGLGLGAALAFMITAPATDLAGLGVVRKLHGGGVALRYALGLVVVAVFLGLGADGALGELGLPELHRSSERTHGALHWGSAAGVIALYIGTLLRGGVRGFFGPLLHRSSFANATQLHYGGASTGACHDLPRLPPPRPRLQ